MLWDGSIIQWERVPALDPYAAATCLVYALRWMKSDDQPIWVDQFERVRKSHPEIATVKIMGNKLNTRFSVLDYAHYLKAERPELKRSICIQAMLVVK